MKVLSSEIQMSSSSQIFKNKDETVYVLDENGQVAHKSRVETVEKREKISAARFESHKDYTVDLQHTPQHQESIRKASSKESGTDLDDDLAKNLYMASVFDWAADTIDAMVDHFHNREKAPTVRETGSFQADPVVATDSTKRSADLNLTIYKKMALGFRLKASSLRPEQMEVSDDRIRVMKSHEKEKTEVQASGTVQMADGSTIDFSLTVGMHRENHETKMETYRLVDPLVINFTGTSAGLESDRIGFDLDGDGNLEDLARLNEGSGFLALDLNQDGEINSGRELFGPSTGDGFQELSLYDNDRNGWIDENDDIYDKLMVWIQNDSEKGVLEKLSSKGIGAIHLGSVDSEFLLEDPRGRAAGKVVATGVVLTRDGDVKTIQQLDLMV